MRRPFFSGNYGSALGSTANAANIIAQSGVERGRMFQQLGQQISSSLDKFRANKEKKEKEQRYEQQFVNLYEGNPGNPIFKNLGIQSTDEAKVVAKDISKDPQLIQQAMSFMQVANAEEQRKQQLQSQRMQRQLIKQNLAAGRRDNRQLNQTNRFLTTPGPSTLAPGSPDRNSVLRNLRAGKGVTPPARMIPGSSPAEQMMQSPEAKAFIQRAIKSEAPIQPAIKIAQQIDASVAANKNLGVEEFKDLRKAEADMRKEFNTLDATKDFGEVRTAFLKVKTAAENPSAAGDLALVFNYMKILDPGSVVREGEFQTAADATSWLQRSEDDGIAIPLPIAKAIRKLEDGTLLTPDQRKDFLSTARNTASAQFKPAKEALERYKGLAVNSGLRVNQIIPSNYLEIDEELSSSITNSTQGPGIKTNQGTFTIPGLSVTPQ